MANPTPRLIQGFPKLTPGACRLGEYFDVGEAGPPVGVI